MLNTRKKVRQTAIVASLFVLLSFNRSFASTSCICYYQTGRHDFEHHVYDSGCIKYGEWVDNNHGAEPVMVGNQLMLNVHQSRKVYKEVIHECVCGEADCEDIYLYTEGRTIYRLP